MSEEAGTLIERLVRAEIRATQPYHVADARGLIKLDAMENPFPWPARLRQALVARLEEAAPNRYPDPRADGVVAALRSAFGIGAQHGILLGNGSDELIQLLLMAVARPGLRVVSPGPGFVMYRTIAGWLGLEYREVPLGTDFALDAEALLAAVHEGGPSLVFIACPNNPSGNLFDERAVRTLLERAGTLVVIDEAYLPFSPRDHLGWLAQYPNLLLMRTLSKLGLAGLRLGFLVGDPRWIGELDKLRLPYNIGTLNQLAAEVALSDYGVLREQAAVLVEEREHLLRRLQADRRLTVWPSAANFLLVRPLQAAARDVHAALRERGILVKCLDGAHPQLAGCLRLTIGTPEENRALHGALDAALGSS
jgi:histidinol-phosphate aminotransferase